jgi:hypothetical protein
MQHHPTNAETYRAQAKVCDALADTAPTDEIKRQWHALAESYRHAADGRAPQRTKAG